MEGLQYYAISNDTSEGQQSLDAIQQSWYANSSATGSGGQSAGSGSSDQSGSEISRNAPYSIPTDPYLNYQWHLLNVGQTVTAGQIQDIFGIPGQDINVAPAWDQGYSGLGVNVAVVDTGVQLNHPDLVGNINQAYAYDAIRDRPGGGPQGDDPHGTAVAGLIAASANNGIGGTGVAFNATIIPIRYLGAGSGEDAFLNAVTANGAPVDIYNHSWGPNFAFYGRSVAGPTRNEYIALADSARNGRNGLGAIHVFAAGNSAEALHSAEANGWVNSRYTIAVGIVDHDGARANEDGTSTGYGEMAPSVLIVAPSASGPTDILNDFDTGSGLFTTDQEPNGYNVPPLPGGTNLDIDTFPDTYYTSRFGGTSGAAPLVSGVIALMLEANPNLTYRDVQEILIRSARQNDDQDESWITNLVPLFRDPVQHSFSSTNYPIDPDAPLYPSDENLWNDEIVYQLVPGIPIDAAVPASTGAVTTANSDFTVTARADKAWDGWAANNLSVVFETEPDGPPGAYAEIVGGTLYYFDGAQVIATNGKIRVTVVGDGVTWGEIETAIELLGQNPLNPDPADAWFDVDVGDGTALFDPTDEAIHVPFTGGVDATGREAILRRNPLYQGYHPIADPIINREPLSLFTNGAGYTVSDGRGGNAEYGYAHGVVNAALAVELAKQWHLKDQNLPPERTYLVGQTGGIRLRAAQVTNEDSGEVVIPGGLSWATDGFADYFEEFFKEPTITAGMEATDTDPETADSIDPNSLPFGEDDPPVNNRGGFYTFEVPSINPVTGGNNVMSVEWAEVHVTISGDANALDFVRIVLVSPDGTHSELTQNQYRPEDIQHNFQSIATGGVFGDPPGSITPIDENGTNTDTLDWVFSTNRSWGERSDTNPIFDEYGNLIDAKGWELHIENYSGADLLVSDVQIAFHGSAIGSPLGPVERVMGKVGVDSGRFDPSQAQIIGALDGAFNFDRYVTTYSSDSHAPTTSQSASSQTPSGPQEIRIPDEYQERFAENITVYAIDNATGQRVAEFITGYDGNYYFDLPDGEYTIGIEDPLARTALDNTDGHRNYDNEWVVTIDTSDQFTRTAGEIDPVSGKLHFFNDLNFLLDPGSLPPGEVTYAGQVIADIDGDGAQDPQDTGVYNFRVYADLNHTGQYEVGEPTTFTDFDGNYTLVVPTATPNTFTIGVKAPVGWQPTAPLLGFQNDYAQPGEKVNGINFLFEPPSAPTGVGNGYIFGFIFNDKNGDGQQGQNEAGLANRTVFIDDNANGLLDPGETFTLTNAAGAYQFGEVIVGTIRLDVEVAEPYVLTTPADGWFQFELVAGQVVTQKTFGIRNLAVDDYGDLVGAGYKTTGPDAARSTFVEGFSLGATVDGEVRSRNLVETAPGSGIYVESPALNGIGDDQVQSEASFDDEDGVVLLGGVMRPGANSFSITVNGAGGYLNAWFDFNSDGDFDDAGEHPEVLTNADLNPGVHPFVVNAPLSLVDGQVIAARFRWGTADANYFGYDIRGEVEDYLFTAEVPITGDYNADDVVDNADYQLWIQTFGSTTDLRADGNHNGIIDLGDYTVWKDHEGNSNPGAGSGAVALASVSPALVVADEGDSSTEVGAPLASYAIPSVLVGHTLDAPAVLPIASVSAESADEALLLLVSDGTRPSDAASDDDAVAGSAVEHESSDDLELVLAAAFENETDWWYSL